jgi:hypothetical protein
MAIGTQRMGVERYGLELQKRLLGILSDICYIIIIAMQSRRVVHQLQAKLQCKWMLNATRDHLISWCCGTKPEDLHQPPKTKQPQKLCLSLLTPG